MCYRECLILSTFPSRGSLAALLLALLLVPNARAEFMPPQAWLTQGLQVPLAQDWSFSLSSEERLSPRDALLRKLEVQAEVEWSPSRRWDFSAGAELDRGWSRQGDLVNRHEAIGAATFHLYPGGEDAWRLSSRQRLQLGDDEEDGFFVQARHRLRLEWRGWEKSVRVRPYLATEWFYNFDPGAVEENRTALGCLIRATEDWDVDVFLLFRSVWQENADDAFTPVLGITTTWMF